MLKPDTRGKEARANDQLERGTRKDKGREMEWVGSQPYLETLRETDYILPMEKCIMCFKLVLYAHRQGNGASSAPPG
jgi:hypothetical protein